MTSAWKTYKAETGMKGKSIFSPAEADRVRELLREVRASDRAAQKMLRGRLRNGLRFYISDFRKSETGL